MHYVYIIQSLKDNSYYKGYSTDPLRRLALHNNGLSTYTSKKTPWKLVGLFAFDNKPEARLKEKKLKKYGHKSLVALINSDRNILHHYLSGLENR